jgi:hypothetical protein
MQSSIGGLWKCGDTILVSGNVGRVGTVGDMRDHHHCSPAFRQLLSTRANTA